jgi:hypothetical protein
MSHHRCANCRRPLTPSDALSVGKLCDKCDWAKASAEFREEAPTRPRVIIPLAALDMMMSAHD